MDIYELEAASGVVVSVGGQLPQNIALRLQETGGANVLGTNPIDIDKAEDRQKFSQILDSIGVDQPAWKELTSVEAAKAFANEVVSKSESPKNSSFELLSGVETLLLVQNASFKRPERRLVSPSETMHGKWN